MTNEHTNPEPQIESNHHNGKHAMGFWLYLMTDLVSFSALFATYIVLRKNTFGGPSGAELFSLPFVLVETLILLTSSFCFGLVLISAQSMKKQLAQMWLLVVFLLGASFLWMELHEFGKLIAEGNSPSKSAFLSAFFTLVGTHGLHISVGLLWVLFMIIAISKRGLTESLQSKLTRLGMFWHFLDFVWIFIFTIVYLLK